MASAGTTNLLPQAGPHVHEAQLYLGLLRLSVVALYVMAFFQLIFWLPMLALVSLSAALCGSLLLQADPWLPCAPLVAKAAQSLQSKQLEDGLLFLDPFAACCCVGTVLSCLDLLISMPSHSTGMAGSLRPLAVLLGGTIHSVTFAGAWHLRGLMWRPHGGVTYADIYQAAAGRETPEPPLAQDVEAPKAGGLQLASSASGHEAGGGTGGTGSARAEAPKAPAPAPSAPAAPAPAAPAPVPVPVPAAPEGEPAEDDKVAASSSSAGADAAEADAAPEADVAEGEAQAANGEPGPNSPVELLLRLPSGRRVHCHLNTLDAVRRIYDFVESEALREPEIRAGTPYVVMTLHPKQCYRDKSLTLAEVGLVSSTVLNVELQK
ncbi:unnamed protein product [Effrenium voratum]|nr:unnamed protein product [Effrenium voratum]